MCHLPTLSVTPPYILSAAFDPFSCRGLQLRRGAPGLRDGHPAASRDASFWGAKHSFQYSSRPQLDPSICVRPWDMNQVALGAAGQCRAGIGSPTSVSHSFLVQTASGPAVHLSESCRTGPFPRSQCSPPWGTCHMIPRCGGPS